MFRKLLLLPYLLGILWTCAHPIVSVLTGELKCRGWFLDESAIEVQATDTSKSNKLPKLLPTQTTLCQALDTNQTINLSCREHGDLFHLAMVVPRSNAIDPIDEAIVLVVPSFSSSATFSAAFLQLLTGLADPIQTPWMAKTILVVSPSSANTDLRDTVSLFLDAYLGSRSSFSTTPPLPPKFSTAILRSLLVLNIQDDSITATTRAEMTNNRNGLTDFQLLPQGTRGSLPNMDLVTLIGKLYQRATFLNVRPYPNSTFLAHGYTQESKSAKEWIRSASFLQGRAKTWAKDFVNMAYFAYTLAAGPHPPHSAALDRGIDSLTIHAKFQGTYWKNPSMEFISILENVLRGLSNLHERLHHSFVLYWLPSPDKFVSHMEYFLPNILVLLPLAVRAFGIIVMGTATVDLNIVGSSLLATMVTMGTMLLSSVLILDNNTMMNTMLLILYVFIGIWWKKTKGKKEEMKQSLQFAACATAAYTLVPIAFCHASLSYVPSVILTPLLAFPDYAKQWKPQRITLMILWILTLPSILLVPRVFDSYTVFVRYGYVPLHMQLLLLLL